MVNKPDHKAGYFLVWVGWSGWGRWTRNDDFSGEIFYSPDVSISWPFHEAHCVVPEDWRGRFAHFRWAAQRDPRDVFSGFWSEGGELC